MKQKFKKIACVFTLALSVCACQAFTGVPKVYAATHNAGYTNISITNGSFDSNPTSSYLDTAPTGWSSNGGKSKKGIINVDNTKSSFDYNCTSSYNLNTNENPGKVGADNKVLMVNARYDNVNDNAKLANDGYTSDSIALEAYSYYRLSAWVNTINDARASITLKGLTEEDRTTPTANHYFSNIQTNPGTNDWQEYAFYIQTNAQSQSIKLSLSLGVITETNNVKSIGATFFDEVQLIKCSESYYHSQIANETDSTKFSTITYEKFDATPTDINLNFENGLDDWEQFGTDFVDTTYTAAVQTTTSMEQGSDFGLNNNKALLISSDENNKIHIGFRSKPFDIKMATIYRISVMAKATNIVGTAKINFVETEDLKKSFGDDEAPLTSTLSFSSTNTNQLTNDYQEFVFYVSGYELYDTKAQLELVFGEETAPASGSVVFDSIKIQHCSYANFQGASDDDKNKKITFSTITGTPTFTNGTFNNAHSTKTTLEYPLTPDNWTLAESEGAYVFGVVNTTKWSDIPANKKPVASSPLNPSIETADGTVIPVLNTSPNNILMMYNKPNSRQVVQSPTFTADSNKFFKLSFNYYTFGNNLTIKIKNSNGVLVFEDENISTTTAWQTYNVVLRTEYFTAETLSMEFALDNSDTNTSSYVFLDNFQFFALNSYTAENFQHDVDTNKHTIDFSNLGIQQKGDLNPTTNMYEATLFDGALVSGTQIDGGAPIAFGGIIDEENTFGITFPTTHTNPVQHMLAIKTCSTADYTLTSKNTISLTTDTYYKFSVYAKTSFETLGKADESFGAYFKLVGLNNAQISKICSDKAFEQYVIYLKATEAATINVQFGLNSNTNQNQLALFDTFAFETIDQATFESAVQSKNVLVVNSATTPDDPEPDPDPTPTDPTSGANVWIQASTILMIAAIVVAVVGGLIRKARKNKIKVKKHAEYTQKVALVRDASVLEAEKRRAKEIDNLVKEKEDLAKYLKELEADNKKRVSETRKQTGKVITRKAEKDFKTYAAQRQKLIRDMGRIDDRITDAQSQEYLNRIIKIVQSEKVKEMEEENKNLPSAPTDIDEKK